MKRIVTLMKRGAKWYLQQCAKTYYLAPSGSLPYLDVKES